MGSTLVSLPLQSVEDRSGCQVASAVIEELTREAPRRRTVDGLAHRDATRRLYDAVEPAAVRPWPRVPPGVEVDDDEPRVAFRQRARTEPEPVESARPVSADD